MATKQAEKPVQPPAKVDDYTMAPPPRQECDAPGCHYITPEGIPTWELLIGFQSCHIQAVHQTGVGIKQVDTVQPAQQVHDTQQGDQHDGVTVQPVQQEKVVTQQVPDTQQPEHRHAEVVVEDHAASQDQVLLSMGGGGRCTTSPQESDNNRQAQSKQWCCTTSPQESDKHRQAQTKQRVLLQAHRSLITIARLNPSRRVLLQTHS